MKDATGARAAAGVGRELPTERADVADSTQQRAVAVLARVFGLQAANRAAGVTTATVAGWDSAQHVELVVALEDEFGCMFEPEDVPELVSIERLGEIVAKRCAPK